MSTTPPVRRRASRTRGRQPGRALRRRDHPPVPRLPAAAIARRASARGSGRAQDPDAAELAVVASVRHEDTGYDTLLMRGVQRAEERERVLGEVERALERWRRR